MAVTDTENKKKITRKKVSKKKVAAKRRGRPPKNGAVTKTRATKKRVAKKAVSAATDVNSTVVTNTTGRRGRPLTVESLQNKLSVTQAALASEKEKRKTQVAALKQKLAAAVSVKGELQKQLREVSKTLSAIETERKAKEREQARVEKLEAARQAAIDTFLEKWEKKQQLAAGKKTVRKKGRRGRPRKA